MIFYLHIYPFHKKAIVKKKGKKIQHIQLESLKIVLFSSKDKTRFYISWFQQYDKLTNDNF